MFVDDLELVLERVNEKGHDLSKIFFKNAVELAKKEKSAELAYELALVADNGKNANVEKIREELCKVVEESNNPKFSYLYARDIPKANIPALQKVVEESNDAESAINFASDIYNIDITKLQQIVLDSKNPKYAYQFAKYVEKADVKSMEDIVVKSKDIKLIENFAKDVDGANTKRLKSVRSVLAKKYNVNMIGLFWLITPQNSSIFTKFKIIKKI